ncbi:hypothetical protein ACRAWF_44670 [Streptomyces sp. L7]
MPSASVSASALVVRNLYRTYEIPWQLLTGIDWEPRTGVLSSTSPTAGKGAGPGVRPPGRPFGRHRKVIATLEQGRGQGGRVRTRGGTRDRVVGNSGVPHGHPFRDHAGGAPGRGHHRRSCDRSMDPNRRFT